MSEEVKYTVHMVSFKNMEHASAYNTLHRGSKAEAWQIVLLENFLKELKQENLSVHCNNLL